MQVSVEGEERGVWASLPGDEWQRFDFLFKLVPWEILATEEPELTTDLESLLLARDVVIANPPYSLLFQSKAVLAWLWHVFPHHPLLLEAALQPLEGHCVSKPVFGREGQNVDELQAKQVVNTAEGDFDEQIKVYQQWADLPTEANGYFYQAGVFWAGEACAIGFRREAGIMRNSSAFVSHYLNGNRS
jgi:glutathionylspermidine synthase